MVRKETYNEDIEEIRKMLGTERLVIGTKEALNNLRTGKLSKVFLTVNCPDDVKKELSKYGELSNVKIVTLDCPNDELGIICKKPYSISVIGLKSQT